jgi:hypothetical protein
MHPEHPHYTVADDSHQVICTVTRLSEPLPPMLEGRIRQLESSGERLRAAIDFVDSRTVIRLSPADV